jgi:HAD superfamily hydrolase (TIGR01549 family)
MPDLPDRTEFDAVLLDVDGTIVDSNYHHVLAWLRAFARFDISVPAWRVHDAIGMGGDRLVTEVAGQPIEDGRGDQLRAAWAEEFEPLFDEIQSLAGSRDFLLAMSRRRVPVVVTSSGNGEHVRRHLKELGAEDLVSAVTTGDDVAKTKPAPDLIEVSMKKVGARHPLMVGDSTWDAIAAARLGLVTYAVLTGGFCSADLIAAGARRVFPGLSELTAALESPLVVEPSA